jgi:hypothetical protein
LALEAIPEGLFLDHRAMAPAVEIDELAPVLTVADGIDRDPGTRQELANLGDSWLRDVEVRGETLLGTGQRDRSESESTNNLRSGNPPAACSSWQLRS